METFLKPDALYLIGYFEHLCRDCSHSTSLHKISIISHDVSNILNIGIADYTLELVEKCIHHGPLNTLIGKAEAAMVRPAK